MKYCLLITICSSVDTHLVLRFLLLLLSVVVVVVVVHVVQMCTRCTPPFMLNEYIQTNKTYSLHG